MSETRPTSLWTLGREAFAAWERAAAPTIEAWLRSPAFLRPAGTFITALSKAKIAVDQAQHHLLASLGLPTKRDQERALHGLNELMSRLTTLEDRLRVVEQRRSRR